MSTQLQIAQVPSSPAVSPELHEARRVRDSIGPLESWMRAQDYAGYEPFDLMNSPYLGGWAQRFPFNVLIRQYGRRFSGFKIRELLRVPMSKNCKALGLILAGYCDLTRCGEDWTEQAQYIKSELKRLRSPEEKEFCWGYDWVAISLRAGNVMPAFSPNAVATVFCGDALLDMAEVFGDQAALEMALSAGRFFATRLNRSLDTDSELCFSYTPTDRTQIYNSTALVGAFLARLFTLTGESEYLQRSRRCMQYLINRQLPNGAWHYGATRWQGWIDSFHTGYNLDSLLQYRNLTGEDFVTDTLNSGYEYYKRVFFTRGFPTYYCDRLYPIDIHCCSQALLTFCCFARHDQSAVARALAVARWTMENMHSQDGTFYYQRHRTWTNRTPFLRWGQAWMFKALSRLWRTIVESSPVRD